LNIQKILSFKNHYLGLFCYRIKVLQGIDEISREKVDILSQLWVELFEKDIGKEHLRKLLDHVEAFYSDIIIETEERKLSVIERIESLQKEKDTLKRLLKEDVEEVPGNVPLYTLTVNIDDSLKNLREKLHKRRQQIENFINEQNQLCNGKNINFFTEYLFQ
jgi:Microtubule associated protein (MAP65/ASE1 family)